MRDAKENRGKKWPREILGARRGLSERRTTRRLQPRSAGNEVV